MPAVLPELAPAPPAPAPVMVVTQTPPAVRWLPLLAVALVALNILLGGGFWLAKRLKTVGCNACGQRTDKSHADCPFRDRNAIARLVVLDGPDAGQTLPLRLGANILGRSPRAQVRVRGRRISWRRHGVLTIEGARALYTPRPPSRWRRGIRDRVNGWPVREPRLLGIGALLTVGERRLRFEVKPDVLKE
jgi:hypothetical protein